MPAAHITPEEEHRVEELRPGPSDQPAAEMDLLEFVNAGFLQEVNRRFFHPLGLALSARKYDDGRVELNNIWDIRGFAEEGFTMEPWTDEDRARGRRIERELQRRLKIREERLGFGIQPL